MTTAVVIASIVAYLMVGGAVGRVLLDRARSHCPRWKATVEARKTGEYLSLYERCDLDHHTTPLLAGALWPLAFPVLVGAMVAGWPTSRDERAERREKRRQADHERKMAELEVQRAMTMESVKFLVENGIKADVPGLFEASGGGS